MPLSQSRIFRKTQLSCVDCVCSPLSCQFPSTTSCIYSHPITSQNLSATNVPKVLFSLSALYSLFNYTNFLLLCQLFFRLISFFIFHKCKHKHCKHHPTGDIIFFHFLIKFIIFKSFKRFIIAFSTNIFFIICNLFFTYYANLFIYIHYFSLSFSFTHAPAKFNASSSPSNIALNADLFMPLLISLIAYATFWNCLKPFSVNMQFLKYTSNIGCFSVFTSGRVCK